MSSSVSGTLQHLLAMVESQQQPKEAEKPESTAAATKLAEEAEEEEGPAAKEEVEMAKMLCSLSQQGVAENDQQQQPPKTDDDCDSGEVEKMDLDLADEDQKPTEISFKEEFVKKETTERSLAQPISVQISPIQQKRQNSADEKIRKDANFSSFAEFEKAFEEWKQSYHHPFRVASSEKHEDRELAARFKYRYVVYHCSRYGEPRKRGAGRRPHQNYLLSKKKSNNTKIVAPSPSRPCGCNAKLRLNFHAQNEGSLCVTTLVTEHNHAPASSEEGGNNASGFGLSSMKKSRKCSPGDDSSGEGCDHSPNSTASSIAHAVMTMTAGPLSPLSLQSALNHSPSSGGQSSSEGAAAVSEALGLSLNTLLAAHHCQMQLSSAAMAEDNKSNSMQKLMLANTSNYSPHSKQPKPSLISPLAKSNGALSAFLAKAHLQQQQQQQQNNQQSRNHAEPSSSNLRHSALGSSGGGGANDLFSPSRQSAPTMVEQLQQQALLPLIHDLLRSGQKQQAPATNTEHHQNQLLLSLLSPQQRQQQQQQRKEQQQPNNMASNSSILASLQQSLQQQNSNVLSASAHSSPSSLLSANPQLQHAVLQLQLQQLINKAQQQQQGQATAGSSSSSSNGHNSQSAAAAKAQLLQQLLGQHAQRGGVAGFGGQQMQQQQTQQHRNAHPLAMAALHFGGKHEIVDNTIAQTRTEMVQEADLLLQALVSQMIRAQDLHTYLRRLRQFLTENCD